MALDLGLGRVGKELSVLFSEYQPEDVIVKYIETKAAIFSLQLGSGPETGKEQLITKKCLTTK